MIQSRANTDVKPVPAEDERPPSRVFRSHDTSRLLFGSTIDATKSSGML